MMILPILTAAIAGFLLRHFLPLALNAAVALWRQYRKPPAGHHNVRRGGKVFPRKNPKPKQQQLPLAVPNE